MNENTRISKRFAYTSAVSFVPLGISGSSLHAGTVGGETVNVSNEGMCLRVKKRPIKVGSVIQVRMPVHSLKVTVPVLSEVRWIKEETPMYYTIGVRFIS
jgi:hypothetical protein